MQKSYKNFKQFMMLNLGLVTCLLSACNSGIQNSAGGNNSSSSNQTVAKSSKITTAGVSSGVDVLEYMYIVNSLSVPITITSKEYYSGSVSQQTVQPGAV